MISSAGVGLWMHLGLLQIFAFVGGKDVNESRWKIWRGCKVSARLRDLTNLAKYRPKFLKTVFKFPIKILPSQIILEICLSFS